MECTDYEVTTSKEENVEFEYFDNGMNYHMLDCYVSVNLPSFDGIGIDLEIVRYLYTAFKNAYDLQDF